MIAEIVLNPIATLSVAGLSLLDDDSDKGNEYSKISRQKEGTSCFVSRVGYFVIQNLWIALFVMAGVAFAVAAVLDVKFDWFSTTSQSRESNNGISLGMVLIPSVTPSIATGLNNTNTPTTMSDCFLPFILSPSQPSLLIFENPMVTPSLLKPSKRKSNTPSHFPSMTSPTIDNKSRHPNPAQSSQSSKEPTLPHAAFGS
jgi:hypothetical protein